GRGAGCLRRVAGDLAPAHPPGLLRRLPAPVRPGRGAADRPPRAGPAARRARGPRPGPPRRGGPRPPRLPGPAHRQGPPARRPGQRRHPRDRARSHAGPVAGRHRGLPARVRRHRGAPGRSGRAHPPRPRAPARQPYEDAVTLSPRNPFLLATPLFLALAALAACKGDEAAAGQRGGGGPAKVGVITLEAEPVTLTRELPGRVSAYRVAEVRARVDGIVLERRFTEGSDVKEGQVLFQIDPAPYRAALQSAQAQLARAQATV